jgi:hypothetical protein
MLGIQILSRPCNPLSIQRARHTRYLVGTFNRLSPQRGIPSCERLSLTRAMNNFA